MWSLFPKIYDDYKILLYSSKNNLKNPTEPGTSKKESLPILDCLYTRPLEGTQENSDEVLGFGRQGTRDSQDEKPKAPLDKKSCCMLMEKVKKDLLKKNIDINNYMIIENCYTGIYSNKGIEGDPEPAKKYSLENVLIKDNFSSQ